VAFTVVYDACVLHPAPLRDLLLRLAETRVVHAKWTDEILDETFASILERRPDLDPERLKRTRKSMCEAIEDCLVTGYEGLLDRIELPDADDRHVVAAAIRCGAQAIVTANLADFPKAALEPLEMEALHPDIFVLDLIDLAPGLVLEAIQDQAAGLKNPPKDVDDVLDALERCGLVRSVAELRLLFGEDA
jgi:hypothetical protein